MARKKSFGERLRDMITGVDDSLIDASFIEGGARNDAEDPFEEEEDPFRDPADVKPEDRPQQDGLLVPESVPAWARWYDKYLAQLKAREVEPVSTEIRFLFVVPHGADERPSYYEYGEFLFNTLERLKTKDLGLAEKKIHELRDQRKAFFEPYWVDQYGEPLRPVNEGAPEAAKALKTAFYAAKDEQDKALSAFSVQRTQSVPAQPVALDVNALLAKATTTEDALRLLDALEAKGLLPKDQKPQKPQGKPSVNSDPPQDGSDDQGK